MADDKQVCDCNGVCKGMIVEAIKAGKQTVQAVGKATRAGTGCGSCRKMIKGLIEAIAGEVKADPAEAWYVPAIPLDKPALGSGNAAARAQSGFAGHRSAGGEGG